MTRLDRPELPTHRLDRPRGIANGHRDAAQPGVSAALETGRLRRPPGVLLQADAVARVLDQRLENLRLPYPKASILAALFLHGFLALAFLVGPGILAMDREPPEFVAVEIVPAVSLPQRRAPAPEPEAPPPSPEEEEEESPEPAPEPEVAPLPPPQPAPEEPPPRPRRPEPRATRAAPGPPSAGSPDADGNDSVVLGFDNPDFTYGYYVDRMRTIIRSHWARPPLGGEVEMIIHFRIHSNGRISEVKIVRSSGYNSFDLAGRRAVEASSPLPPLPRSYRRPSLGVNLVIR